MAKSKFDYALLKPIEDTNTQFDISKLKPIEETNLLNFESESALSKLPRNIVIGLLNLAKSTANIPHDLVQGIENRGQQFGQEINLPGIKAITKPHTPISSYIFNNDIDYAKEAGQEGEGTLLDNVIQKGIEYAPELLTGRALLKMGLRKFPLTQKMAGKPLREAQQLVEKKNIPNIVNNDALKTLVEKSRPYLDNTRETQRLLYDAETGKYEPLFSLQSQLGKESRSLQKSVNASERRIYKEPQELKKDILDSMESHLRTQGHDDIADLLRNGVSNYRNYIKMKENVYPVLKKLGIPVGLFASLAYGKDKLTDLLK